MHDVYTLTPHSVGIKVASNPGLAFSLRGFAITFLQSCETKSGKKPGFEDSIRNSFQYNFSTSTVMECQLDIHKMATVNNDDVKIN